MSLRTRTSSLPQVSKPNVRSRIPISRAPQPRENRLATTWRLAKPARIAAALRAAQSLNSGGWFVAGKSVDVGRKESVTRTIAGREVVFWRNSAGDLIAGPGARARTWGRCWTNAQSSTAPCIAGGMVLL